MFPLLRTVSFVITLQYILTDEHAAKEKIVLGEAPNTFADGDGATGDPAALGVYAMLLGKAGDIPMSLKADEEVTYLVDECPRWANGAISQRADVAELWWVITSPIQCLIVADRRTGLSTH